MSLLLQSIARDNPRRITNIKQIQQMQELRRQGLVTFSTQWYDGKCTALFEIKLLRPKETELATREDFYKPKTQSLL